MTPVLREPFESPAAWIGEEQQHTDEWMYHLSDAEVAELDAALQVAKHSGRAMGDLTPDDFPLPTLEPTLRGVLHTLDKGRGFQLIRGVPVERYSLDDAMLLYWGIGLYLGSPVSQNNAGDLLGHVRDTGADPNDPAVRKYKTRINLGFHTDGADIIGLLCLKQGKSGGQSRIVSSVSVYNEVLRRRPDLVDLMYEPWYLDSHDQQSTGENPFFMMPISWYDEDMLRTFYLRWYIEQAQRHAEVPRLTEQQIELLDLIDSIAEDPHFHLGMDFQPGDIQLLKNTVALHARTEYEDYDEPERKRHLLRLWLTAHQFADGHETLRSGVPTKVGHDTDLADVATARG